MVTGSVASSLQGEPRSTHDIDVVVALTLPATAPLLNAFPPPRFYLDESSIHQAIARRDMFNLLDGDTGDKVDFWLLTDEAFDQQRFSRKIVEEFNGLRIKVSRPEDTILMKLKWAELAGGSEKQFGDALGVYELQHPKLDQAYLDDWAARLGLNAWLARLRDDAQPT